MATTGETVEAYRLAARRLTDTLHAAAPKAPRPQPLTDALAAVDLVRQWQAATSDAAVTEAVATASLDALGDALDATEPAHRYRVVRDQAAAVDAGLVNRLGAALVDAREAVLAAVRPPFEAAVASLVKAAARLPAGAAATDDRAARQAGASDALSAAEAALATLQAAAEVYDPVGTDEAHWLPAGVDVVRVVTITGRVEQLRYPHNVEAPEKATNTPDVINRVERVRALVMAYKADELAACIGVARGQFGNDVRLSLPADAAELARRREAVRTAHQDVPLRGRFEGVSA